MGSYDYYPERQILIRVKKEKPIKPKRRFWLGLLIYAIIIAALGVGALVYLWVKLDDYQAEHEKQVKMEDYEDSLKRAPQEYFLSYVNKNTDKDWMEIWKQNHADTLDSDETIETKIGQLFDDTKLSYFRADEYTDSTPVYLIKSWDTDVAKISLKGGDLEWSVSEAKVFLEGNESTSLTVPADSVVYCNGVAVSEECVTGNVQNEDMSEYLEDMTNPVTYYNYEITGLLSEPVISVSGSHELVSDSEGNYQYVQSSEVSEGTVGKAKDFVSSLLNYFKMGKSNAEGNMNSVLSHVVSGSKAAKVIRASYDGVIWTTGKNVSYEITTGDAIIHADNCVSVDVSYHSGDEDAVSLGLSDGTYRVYFLDLGKGLAIYNFELK